MREACVKLIKHVNTHDSKQSIHSHLTAIELVSVHDLS